MTGAFAAAVAESPLVLKSGNTMAIFMVSEATPSSGSVSIKDGLVDSHVGIPPAGNVLQRNQLWRIRTIWNSFFSHTFPVFHLSSGMLCVVVFYTQIVISESFVILLQSDKI
jgi:hypothetical protein